MFAAPLGNSSQRLMQVLAWSSLNRKHWRRSLQLIRKISKARSIIPSSFVVQDEHILVGVVHHDGELTEVSKGEHQGTTVAIKHFKMNNGDPDKTFKVSSVGLANHPYSVFPQKLCREIIVWKHLTHPNILPLWGVSISMDTHRLHIITEWMPNGNIMRYTRSNLAANRLKLVSQLAVLPQFIFPTKDIQLSEVMSGVTFLHDHSIVHGDLKGVHQMSLSYTRPH